MANISWHLVLILMSEDPRLLVKGAKKGFEKTVWKRRAIFTSSWSNLSNGTNVDCYVGLGPPHLIVEMFLGQGGLWLLVIQTFSLLTLRVRLSIKDIKLVVVGVPEYPPTLSFWAVDGCGQVFAGDPTDPLDAPPGPLCRQDGLVPVCHIRVGVIPWALSLVP